MLPSPSCPRAGQSGLWQNWACGSIGDPSGARFGDHALWDAGWARPFQGVTSSSRFNGVLPPAATKGPEAAGDAEGLRHLIPQAGGNSEIFNARCAEKGRIWKE